MMDKGIMIQNVVIMIDACKTSRRTHVNKEDKHKLTSTTFRHM